MKSVRRKAGFVALTVLIAVVHYAVFSVSYVETEIPGAGDDPARSAIIKNILSFPLGYLVKVPAFVEWFLPIASLNSLLWGAGFATVAARVFRKN